MDFKHGAFITSLFHLGAWAVAFLPASGAEEPALSISSEADARITRGRCCTMKENGEGKLKAGRSVKLQHRPAAVGRAEGRKFGSKTLRL